MDPLILGGVFAAGVGVGLSFLFKTETVNPNPSPVVCHCECTGDKASSGQSIWRELALALLCGIIVGVGLIFVIKATLVGHEVQPPAKGKGKRGIYGTHNPLSITG